MCTKSFQLCPTLCNPVDYSRPGSSVHGILQARILEWVAMPSSRGSSRPKNQSCLSYISYIGRGSCATWESPKRPRAILKTKMFNKKWIGESQLDIYEEHFISLLASRWLSDILLIFTLALSCSLLCFIYSFPLVFLYLSVSRINGQQSSSSIE